MAFWISALVLVTTFAAQAPEQELIRLEQQLTEALARYDKPTVERLWADDLVFVGLNGKASSKLERLAGLNAPSSTSVATVTAATNDDVKVRLYGQTAVVTLRSTWITRTDNGETREPYMTTHVWVRRNNTWQLVSAHVSRVTP